MVWQIEDAAQQFTAIIQAAKQTPQLIYTDDDTIVALIPAELFQEFLNWQQNQCSLADTFSELQQICLEENYTFEPISRNDRCQNVLGEQMPRQLPPEYFCSA